VLRPSDEGAQRADFAAFRSELQRAVMRRDEDAIERAVDPGIRVDFGGNGGVVDFRNAHFSVAEERERFWRDFGWVLAHGGRFVDSDTFAAPYVYAAWPDEFDSFDCLAIVGTRVRLRAAPSLTAPILTSLDFAIVEALRDAPGVDAGEWRHVRTADGRTGYVAARYTRSPVDYRALFTFTNGRWVMTAYVAGD
jgi:hypothetical protein